MKNLLVRPPRQEDIELLELWRAKAEHADLQVPHGYEGSGVETAIVEDRDNSKVNLGLTYRLVLAIDPLIRNPESSAAEISESLKAAERSVIYHTSRSVAIVDAFLQVPNDMPEYIELLEKRGYVRLDPECVILCKRLTSLS